MESCTQNLADLTMTSPIPFCKMHGLGNDFVVIDAVHHHISPTSEWCKHIADRHFGIGCDQILLLEAPKHPQHDFFYRIYNQDGSLSEQCGNGARCLALFVHRHGLSSKPHLRVGVMHGEMSMTRISKNAWNSNTAEYQVNMGAPIFKAKEIPYLGTAPDANGVSSLSLTIDHHQHHLAVMALSMGNPHAVLHVEDVQNAPVVEWGSRIESHADFPQRTNVIFMQIINRHTAKLRVFERGIGETLACGSGACAAVVAGIRAKWLANDHPITVQLSGGKLLISWEGFDATGQAKPVIMQGLATEVFSGTFLLPS